MIQCGLRNAQPQLLIFPVEIVGRAIQTVLNSDWFLNSQFRFQQIIISELLICVNPTHVATPIRREKTVHFSTIDEFKLVFHVSVVKNMSARLIPELNHFALNVSQRQNRNRMSDLSDL